MATDPCTRCLRSSVRAEVFVTRSMLAVARRGWELRAPLLPVFLHEALFLPADLHPAMARARGRAEAAKMHVVLAVAGRGDTTGAAGGALVTAGTAWHALKFLHQRGLLATRTPHPYHQAPHHTTVRRVTRDARQPSFCVLAARERMRCRVRRRMRSTNTGVS